MSHSTCSTFFAITIATILTLPASSIPSNEVTFGSNFPSNGRNSCVMYGRCGEGPSAAGQAGIPCKVNIPPAKVDLSALTPSQIHTFEEICRFNLTNDTLCCDASQIIDLVSSASTLKGFFFKCPACLHSLYSYLCGMTCHPDQGSFLEVVKSEKADTDPKKFKVVENKISVASTFRDGIYSACAQVTSDSTPHAIDLVCTARPTNESCSGKYVLASLGSSDNAPFLTTQEYDDDRGVSPTRPFFNRTIYRCQDALTKEIWPMNPSSCSCSDCPESCFSPVFPQWPDYSSQIGIFDIVLISLFGLSFTITVCFGIVAWRFRKTHPSMSDAVSGPENENYLAPPKGWYQLIEDPVQKWILFVTRHPIAVIVATVLLFILAACGLLTLKMQNDPVELWSAPNARSRIEKKFFDEHFGPFYRVEQVIVTVDDRGNFTVDNVTHSPIFDRNFLRIMLKLQSDLLKATGTRTNTTLQDLCFKPLGECMVQSPLNYIQSNARLLDEKITRESLVKHIDHCLTNPLDIDDAAFEHTSCLGKWGGPGLREVVLGGYDDVGNYTQELRRYVTARSFIITMLLHDSLDQSYRERAEDFESSWLDILHRASAQKNEFITSDGQNVSFRISFFSGRSVGDEISRQSESDVLTISISYLLMFVYISLTLGSFVSWKRIFVDSKVSLGLAGVLIVLASVIMSIGILSPFIEFNLIIIEVIPFLILAIGVDNMFLMVVGVRTDLQFHSKMCLQRPDVFTVNDKSIAEELAESIGGEIGQSIIISVISESACFLIGYFVSSMPAVQVFAFTAGVALIILLVLQFSMFVALLYLDTCRYVKGYPDPIVAPLHFIIKLLTRSSRSPVSGSANDGDNTAGSTDQQSIAAPNDDSSPDNDLTSLIPIATENKSIFQYICKDILAEKLICSIPVRTLIIITWLITLFLSLMQIPLIEVGLDQEDSVPRDSYVLQYMKDQKELLRVGAPLYFVVDSSNLQFNYSQAAYRKAISGSANSSDKSLDNIVYVWSQEGPYKDNLNTKFIRSHATSWVNEFANVWFHNGDCCRVKRDDKQQIRETCAVDRHDPECGACSDISEEEFQGDVFKMLLREFLSQRPGSPPDFCSNGGSAQYPGSINYTGNYDIRAAYYTTYHLPAKSSQDMVDSIRTARLVADEIESDLRSLTHADVRVFPYSIFYVFYEQYLTTWTDTLIGLGASTLAVLIVVFTSRQLGSFAHHLIFTVALLSFTVHVIGLICFMNVSLNALTIVNLIMSIGISVEFIAHIALDFVSYQRQRFISSYASLKCTMDRTGAPVLAGITLTKLVGIVVLAFATSQIFTVYYFRFYTALIIVGAYHALFVLPALLMIPRRPVSSSDNPEPNSDADNVSN